MTYRLLSVWRKWRCFAFYLAVGFSVAILTAADSTLSLAQSAPDKVTEDTAAALFSHKCSGCHTVGHGALVGPDLQVVAAWNKADVEANVKRMEKMVGPLKDDEVKALAAFLKDPKVKGRIKIQAEQAVQVQVGQQPASVDIGRQIFFGGQRLKNGGPSCISCHQVEGHGGTMGKELTDVYTRMGESALLSACEQPNFPVMKAIYQAHPIEKQEALNLTKFLASVKDSKQKNSDPPIAEAGFLGAFVLLGCIIAFYSNRNRGARARLSRR